jgi:hypothetical protein
MRWKLWNCGFGNYLKEKSVRNVQLIWHFMLPVFSLHNLSPILSSPNGIASATAATPTTTTTTATTTIGPIVIE